MANEAHRKSVVGGVRRGHFCLVQSLKFEYQNYGKNYGGLYFFILFHATLHFLKLALTY
jgi:hypothetical protein